MAHAPGGLTLDGVYQDNGYQQITSLAAATSLTVPAGTLMAVIVCETQPVRYRGDGTNPTATVGMPLAVGVNMIFNVGLSTLKFIEQSPSAVLNINYYK